MTFCLQISLPPGLLLALMETVLSSRCWCEHPAKHWDVEEALWALASCSQSRCCRYQKKCVSNQNYSSVRHQRRTALPFAQSHLLVPYPGCSIWPTGDPHGQQDWIQPSQLSVLLPGAIFCSASFLLSLKEEVEEISHIFQQLNLPLQQWSAHPTHYTCTLGCSLTLQTFLLWWCYRNEVFSGCLGKAGKIHCL